MSTETSLDQKIKTGVTIPKLWKVIFHNDDSTPIEFVIGLLMSVFKHSEDAAKEITLEIHNTGSGIAGIYPHEIAEHKGIEAAQLSRANGYPLKITIEQE